ncbi:hypothetical protein N505_0108510 [Rhodococcus aetherivorans]|nr:hypothetical protein N505_0108510 [Rhodococcus aetherivorans]
MGYCGKHTERFRRHGDPDVVVDTRRDDAGYFAAHGRVYRDRGPARERVCPCGERAAHWAYDHEDPDERVSAEGLPYSLQSSHYRALCVSCHKLLDLAHGQAWERGG